MRNPFRLKNKSSLQKLEIGKWLQLFSSRSQYDRYLTAADLSLVALNSSNQNDNVSVGGIDPAPYKIKNVGALAVVLYVIFADDVKFNVSPSVINSRTTFIQLASGAVYECGNISRLGVAVPDPGSIDPRITGGPWPATSATVATTFPEDKALLLASFHA